MTLGELYQDAIYQRFKVRFPDYRIEVAWDGIKEAWSVNIIRFLGRQRLDVTALITDNPDLFTKQPGPFSKALMALAKVPDWKPELTELGRQNVDRIVDYAFEEMSRL